MAMRIVAVQDCQGECHHHRASEKEIEELRELGELVNVWTDEEYKQRWGYEFVDPPLPPWAM